MKNAPLFRKRIGMVDLEYRQLRQAIEPVGASVEARTENYELFDSPVERSPNRVVDEAGARDGGGARACPPAIHVAGNELRDAWNTA